MFFIIIIVISPLQYTAGHRPLQLLAISLDLGLLASSFCQPSCVNRHSTWRPTLRLPRCGLHSRTRLPQRSSVLRLIWPVHCHFSMLIRCDMSATLVLCWITWFRIRSRRETPIIALSIARWTNLNLWTTSRLHMSWPVERTNWRLLSLACPFFIILW
jgi:hypothetical protein